MAVISRRSSVTLSLLLLLVTRLAVAGDEGAADLPTGETAVAGDKGAADHRPGEKEEQPTDDANAIAAKRLPITAFWYLRVGIGGARGDQLHLGPSLGIGRRWLVGPISIDASILNATFYRFANEFDGSTWGWARVASSFYLDPKASHTGYLGGGVSVGSSTLPRARALSGTDWFNVGVSVDLNAGYEFARTTSTPLFVEANLSLPTYRLESHFYDGTPPNQPLYAPTATLSLGLGWGRPREQWSPSTSKNATKSFASRPTLDAVGFAIAARTKGKQFDVRNSSGEVVARCFERCDTKLPPGSYELGPFDSTGQREAGTWFDVKGPGGIEFEDANTNRATTGLILGIGGPVLIVVGAALVVSQICIDCEDQERSSAPGVVGLGLALAGLAVTPVGWILYGLNSSPTTYPIGTPPEE